MSEPRDDVELSLGAYVLGALDPAERARIERHLASCPECRGELADLAGLPGLLARLDAAEVERLGADTPAEPEPLALRRTLADLRASRRARRHRRWLAGAAAAAALVVGGGALAHSVYPGAPASHHARAGQVLRAADKATGVHATTVLSRRAWGTAVRLDLAGVPSGTRCELVAVDRAGNTESAGRWRATYAGAAHVDTATDVTRSRLAALRVQTTTGHRLVTVHMPR